MLLWGSVFRSEGLGNEDNFLNSGCCAGPRFQAGKVPPLSLALSLSMRSAAHCFSGHPVFDDTARQTAEKFNVSLGCVDNVSPGALLASSAVPGIQLRVRRGLRPISAYDRLVEQDALLCDGSSGAKPSRCVPWCGQREEHDSNAVSAAGVSGAHQVASFAGGEGGGADCAYCVPSGALLLRADWCFACCCRSYWIGARKLCSAGCLFCSRACSRKSSTGWCWGFALEVSSA